MRYRRDEKISQRELRRLFRYRKDGSLVRRVDTGHSDFTGDVVKGSQMGNGYRLMSIHGERFLFHRVVFKFHHGWCPPFIDHKDRNRENNRIGNLRPALPHQNSSNCKIPVTNTSGVKGVVWRHVPKRWVAFLGHQGTYNHLYCGKNKKAAIAARRQAEKKIFGRFA